MNDPRPVPSLAPLPLTIGCAAAGVQALVMVLLALWELADFTTARAGLVLSTTAFFLIWAAVLGFCGWGLWHLNSWARAPMVMAQLLHLGLAWNFVSPATMWLAVLIGAAAVVVLVGVFHPQSLKAVAEAENA